MKEHVYELRTILVSGAAYGAVLGFLLLLQATIVVGTSAGQVEGNAYALPMSHRNTIETTAQCTELTEATLAGPLTGTAGISHTFTVTVGPSNADLPITYTWQTVEQVSMPRALDRLTDTMEFAWQLTGTQHITVTALNPCGLTVSGFHTITINARTWYNFLPSALRSHFYDPYEPNDLPGQAFGPLASGAAYSAYFPDLEDTDDYYYIEINTKQPIDIRLTVPDSLDLDVWLYDNPTQLPVAGSSAEGLGIDEAFEFTPLKTGKYYIRVWRYNEGSDRVTPYRLVARYDRP